MIKSNLGSEFKKNIEENGEAISTIVGDVNDYISKIDGKLKEQMNSTIDRARKTGRTVHAFAKENPLKFAGIALTVGLLAGWIIKKKD